MSPILEHAARFLLVSSDGHATARMADYRPYLEGRFLDDFDRFLEQYAATGSRNFDPPALARRTDPDVVEEWKRDFIDSGRTDGNHDPVIRLAEMDGEGVAAEVLFPEFGLPFQLNSRFLEHVTGQKRTQDQIDGGNRAYNRWLADFCSAAPDRFAGVASVSFADVDAAVAEIRAAHDAGLAAVVLPYFSLDIPLYDPRHEPIWSVLEELGMPAAAHTGISGISADVPQVRTLPDAAMHPIFTPYSAFMTRQILTHMIWSGILERHPRLRLVITELGSGWVVSELAHLDHTFHRSFHRRDVRAVISKPPSEYFHEQCFMGASIFSAAEVRSRHEIGVENFLIGTDYPHHEGTWRGGTRDVLQATFGLAGMTEEDARLILGANAARVYGFDAAALQPVVDRIGPTPEELLSPPSPELLRRLERGDLHKPL